MNLLQISAFSDEVIASAARGDRIDDDRACLGLCKMSSARTKTSPKFWQAARALVMMTGLENDRVDFDGDLGAARERLLDSEFFVDFVTLAVNLLRSSADVDPVALDCAADLLRLAAPSAGARRIAFAAGMSSSLSMRLSRSSAYPAACTSLCAALYALVTAEAFLGSEDRACEEAAKAFEAGFVIAVADSLSALAGNVPFETAACGLLRCIIVSKKDDGAVLVGAFVSSNAIWALCRVASAAAASSPQYREIELLPLLRDAFTCIFNLFSILKHREKHYEDERGGPVLRRLIQSGDLAHTAAAATVRLFLPAPAVGPVAAPGCDKEDLVRLEAQTMCFCLVAALAEGHSPLASLAAEVPGFCAALARSLAAARPAPGDPWPYSCSNAGLCGPAEYAARARDASESRFQSTFACVVSCSSRTCVRRSTPLPASGCATISPAPAAWTHFCR